MFQAYTVQEMRQECREHGLSSKGSKKQLLKRLNLLDANRVEQKENAIKASTRNKRNIHVVIVQQGTGKNTLMNLPALQTRVGESNHPTEVTNDKEKEMGGEPVMSKETIALCKTRIHSILKKASNKFKMKAVKLYVATTGVQIFPTNLSLVLTPGLRIIVSSQKQKYSIDTETCKNEENSSDAVQKKAAGADPCVDVGIDIVAPDVDGGKGAGRRASEPIPCIEAEGDARIHLTVLAQATQNKAKNKASTLDDHASFKSQEGHRDDDSNGNNSGNDNNDNDEGNTRNNSNNSNNSNNNNDYSNNNNNDNGNGNGNESSSKSALPPKQSPFSLNRSHSFNSLKCLQTLLLANASSGSSASLHRAPDSPVPPRSSMVSSVLPHNLPPHPPHHYYSNSNHQRSHTYNHSRKYTEASNSNRFSLLSSPCPSPPLPTQFSPDLPSHSLALHRSPPLRAFSSSIPPPSSSSAVRSRFNGVMRGDWYSPPLSPVVSSSNPFSFPASALRSCSFRLRDEHTHASSQGHHHTHTTPHHTAITCVSTNDNDPYRHQSAHGHDNSHSTDTNVNPNTLTDNNRDTCNTGDALHIQCNDVNASMNQRQGGMMTVDLNTNTKMNMKMNIMKMSIGSTDISDSPSNSPCFSPIPISPRHKKGSQQHQKNHTNTNKGSDVNNSNTNIEINNNIKNKINNNINNNDNHDHNCSHSLHSSPTGTFLQRTHIEMAPHIRTPLSPLALSPQCASPMDSPRTRNDGNIEPASTVRMKMNTGISYMSDSVHLSVSSRSNSMYTQESSRSGADEKKSQRERKRNVSVHDCDVNTTVHENADGQRHEAKTKLRSIAHQSNIDASLYSESHIHHQQQLQDRFQQAQHQHQQQQEQQEQQKQQAQVQEALQSLMDELHAVRAENEVLYEVKKENSVLTKKIKRLTAEARKASKLETQLKKTNSEQSDRIKNLVDFKEKYERSQVLVTQQTSTIRRLDKKQARLSAKSKSMNALQDRVHKQEYELKQVRGKLTTLQSKHDTLRGAGKGGKDLSKLSSGELAELMAIHSEGVVRVQGAIVEALNQEKQALEDSRLCVICCDRARDCVLDCLHFVTCFECASIINRCPCCRRPITERKEVYM